MSNESANRRPCFALAALVTGEGHHFLFHDISLIGRNDKASVCILDPAVSRKHCIISRIEDNIFTICDYSTCGTLVNEQKLVRNVVQMLHHRDKITIGHERNSFMFLINTKLKMSPEQSDYLKSQMEEQIISLDNSHSVELIKLNDELSKIGSEKSFLQNEMAARLRAQEDSFKSEKLTLSSLVTLTKVQKAAAEDKIKEMIDKFEAEEKALKDEVERKYAAMLKKEEELQNLKSEMELQHQKDRKELEERFQAEIEIKELKNKLEMSEMEKGRLQQETRSAKQQLAEYQRELLESQIEQERLEDEKDEVDTKINILTKKIEKLEETLFCTICSEIFTEPTILNCGHMFCKTCINQWKIMQSMETTCPICRTKISRCMQVYNLDLIKEVVLLASEAKTNREHLLQTRKVEESTRSKRKLARNSPYRREVDAIPRNMIPMVQINDPVPQNHLIQQPIIDLDADSVTWPNPEQRMPIPLVNPTNQVVEAEIDVTNIPHQNTRRRRISTVSYILPIDHTTPFKTIHPC